MYEVDREVQVNVGMTVGMDRDIQRKVLDRSEQVGLKAYDGERRRGGLG